MKNNETKTTAVDSELITRDGLTDIIGYQPSRTTIWRWENDGLLNKVQAGKCKKPLYRRKDVLRAFGLIDDGQTKG